MREETSVRRRRWLGDAWSPWETVAVESGGTSLSLARGGTITIFRDFVAFDERCALIRELEQSRLFRQYKFGNVPEPRVHMLLAAQERVAYQYHGVTMVARSLEDVAGVAALASRTSQRFGGVEWNVGVDIVCYRDGRDSCGWHADDTHHETMVVCTVLESRGGSRRVCVRPKQPPLKEKKNRRASAHEGEAPLALGDEEFELWIGPGDCYSMDRGVHVGYEHAVPKISKTDVDGRRIVAIMRAGDLATKPSEDADSGEPLLSLDPPDRPRVIGHVPGIRPGVLKDGIDDTALYSREALVAKGAHASAQRGVGGSAARGAESVVVSRQSQLLREADGLSWLRYTSTRRQGAGALWRSFGLKEPVRVFRSSHLDSGWGPPKPSPQSLSANYRYDGLYTVVAMWDVNGAPTQVEPSSVADGDDEPAYTFRLVRRDGPPDNACSNADFVRYVAKRARRDAPPADNVGIVLPPIAAAKCGVGGPTADDLDETTAVATALAELVSLVSAHESGWFDPEVAPRPPVCSPSPKKRRRSPAVEGEPVMVATAAQADEAKATECFGRWLAHRKLVWRFEHHRRRSSTTPTVRWLGGPLPVDDALAFATPDAIRDMVAAAASRSIDRAVATALREQAVSADVVVPDDDPRLKESDTRRCGFCGGSQSNYNDLGEFLAFEASAAIVWVHRKCAGASSEVYFDGDGSYVNVVSALKRGRLNKCSLGKKCKHMPKRSGATVGCANSKCRKTYHYSCALATGWSFGHTFTFSCEIHRDGLDYDPDDTFYTFDCQLCGVVEPDDDDEMWQCTRCETWQHAKCAKAHLAASNNVVDKIPDDYVCSRCSPTLASVDDPGVPSAPQVQRRLRSSPRPRA